MNNVFGLQERLKFGCLLSSAAKLVIDLGIEPSSQSRRSGRNGARGVKTAGRPARAARAARVARPPIMSIMSAQVVIDFIENGTKSAPTVGVFYTKMKLSTWAIRHGMARNGPAPGWGVLERL